MPAYLTKYCLEKITDYLDFESLCHDLMTLEGYPNIEPLGGFSDKGRDAIHIDNSGKTTIFAYSVRENWRAKLSEDAAKVKKHEHKCDKIVFISTADYTAGERDEAITSIEKDYGWTLELFGLERLRILLDTTHPQIKQQHPSIFSPEIIQAQKNLLKNENRNHLFISYAPEDRIFAEWLTRKLTAEGYLVWCESFKLLGGNQYPKNVNKAIKDETFRMIAVYSDKSLKNMEIMRQWALASNISDEREIDFLIPIKADSFDISQLDRETEKLIFISFNENWATGLQQLIENLNTINAPKPLINGKEIAIEFFFEKDVLTEEPETLYSNCFSIKKIPTVIYRFQIDNNFPDEESQNFLWAYRKVNDDLVLSFHHPPKELLDKCKITEIGGDSWRDVDKITWKDGKKEKWINTFNLVSELIRKSLIAKSHQKGLIFCPVTKLHHFPKSLIEGNKTSFFLPDGTRNRPINVVGERKFYKPQKSEYYRYHLAPTFFVEKELYNEFSVIFRLRIYLTDLEGNPLISRKRNSRRKHLCVSWWNDEWFKRLLLVSQFLSDDNEITIGDLQKEQIVVDGFPISFCVSGGIDESKLDKKSYEKDETLLKQDDEEEEE